MEFEREEVVSLTWVGFKEPFGGRLLLVLEKVCGNELGSYGAH